MKDGRNYKRVEDRKFKRISVLYGSQTPHHAAFAQHISSRGLFLTTNDTVYAKGSPIVVEIKGPEETWVVAGIVRHAYKVHPSMARFTKPGMGIELVDPPPACSTYLATL